MTLAERAYELVKQADSMAAWPAPKYVYVVGDTFYLIDELSGDDPVGASYAACHREAFGHIDGEPGRSGESWARHFAVDGLWVRMVTA